MYDGVASDPPRGGDDIEEARMHGLVICGLLTLGPPGQTADDTKGPAWLKDFAQAKAKALRENKPIFIVFR